MDLDNMTIDNYPKVNTKLNTLQTEFIINMDEEISISLNNSIILDRSDIYEIENNLITLVSDIKLEEGGNITIVYHKI